MHAVGTRSVSTVVFDWGDTVMRDFGKPGPMAKWDKVELVPGSAVALSLLAKSHVLCLASNAGDSDRRLMAAGLDRVGVRQYFTHLWTSRELGARKPNPLFFQGICDRLEREPAAVIAVGNDYDKDIAPAKSVGMRTVWLNPRDVVPPGNAADASILHMRSLPDVVRLVGGV